MDVRMYATTSRNNEAFGSSAAQSIPFDMSIE
jgi:hypothetical protein